MAKTPMYAEEGHRRVHLMRMVNGLNDLLDPKHHRYLAMPEDADTFFELLKHAIAQLHNSMVVGRGGELSHRNQFENAMHAMAMLMVVLGRTQQLDSTYDNGVWLDVQQCVSLGRLVEDYGAACGRLCCPEDEHHARVHWATRNTAAEEIRRMMRGYARNPEVFRNKEDVR